MAWQSLRERQDITGKQLAETLGVTGAAISQWESGKRIPSHDGYQDVIGHLLADSYNDTVLWLHWMLWKAELHSNADVVLDTTQLEAMGSGKHEVHEWLTQQWGGTHPVLVEHNPTVPRPDSPWPTASASF